MPTETVYGIAADALNPIAIQKIFELKKRPADNPLIVHLAHVDDLALVTATVSPAALSLAESFWPGPLTMVLPRAESVPLITTGGLDSVAVRIPRHPVARALIRLSQRPIAAPSANPFMRLSPTRAENIDSEIAGGLAMILDGGPCDVGLESTVIDMTEWPPRILRLGGLGREELEATVGVRLSVGPQEPQANRRSPGQYPRHYAPKTPLRIVEKLGAEDTGLVRGKSAQIHQIGMPNNPIGYAQKLYAALHTLDLRNPLEILVEAPPQTAEWEVVWDRLTRASN